MGMLIWNIGLTVFVVALLRTMHKVLLVLEAQERLNKEERDIHLGQLELNNNIISMLIPKEEE